MGTGGAAAEGDPGSGAWDPIQYNRFAAERSQPFRDLCQLLEPVVAPRVVDLGCGDGRLTSLLHERLGAASTLGLDASAAMLEEAASRAGPTLQFEPGDLARWQGTDVDLVFSNAALHWVDDHAGVLGRWSASLRPGGQLAVQVPANADHPSHAVARALGEEILGREAPVDPVEANVLPVEAYAEILHSLGFERQHVRLQVYGHLLDSTADVVEWVKGTSLTRFKRVLGPADFERFLDEYRARLIARLGDRRPYFYPFKRILLWGRMSD